MSALPYDVRYYIGTFLDIYDLGAYLMVEKSVLNYIITNKYRYSQRFHVDVGGPNTLARLFTNIECLNSDLDNFDIPTIITLRCSKISKAQSGKLVSLRNLVLVGVGAVLHIPVGVRNLRVDGGHGRIVRPEKLESLTKVRIDYGRIKGIERIPNLTHLGVRVHSLECIGPVNSVKILHILPEYLDGYRDSDYIDVGITAPNLEELCSEHRCTLANIPQSLKKLVSTGEIHTGLLPRGMDTIKVGRGSTIANDIVDTRVLDIYGHIPFTSRIEKLSSWDLNVDLSSFENLTRVYIDNYCPAKNDSTIVTGKKIRDLTIGNGQYLPRAIDISASTGMTRLRLGNLIIPRGMILPKTIRSLTFIRCRCSGRFDYCSNEKTPALTSITLTVCPGVSVVEELPDTIIDGWFESCTSDSVVIEKIPPHLTVAINGNTTTVYFNKT